MLLGAMASSCGSRAATPDGVRPPAQDSGSSPVQDSGSSPAPDLIPVVRLPFDDVRLQGDRVITRNGSDTQVQVRVLRSGDGSVSVVRGAGGGRGLRFPGVSTSATPARAVLAVTTEESVDRVNGLSPGHHDFEFGARFMLDRTSEIGHMDNGNNLVQRGLGDDLSQYKLQVDHRRVSCRIAGDLGGVEPRSRMRVDPEHWYSATCARTGRNVTLRVRRLDDHVVDRVTLRGDTGSVTASGSTPLAVGGKVTDQGRVIRGNSDQFNGLIDDVFLDVGADG